MPVPTCTRGTIAHVIVLAQPATQPHTATHSLPCGGMEERIGKVGKLVC